MGAHDPEGEENELEPNEQNGARQTGPTSASGAPDGAKPIARQKAHSSSREQADCDKNKQASDATAPISNSQWPAVAQPLAQPMQQPPPAPDPLLSNDKSNAIKSANINSNMQAMSGVDANTSSEASEAAAQTCDQKSEEGHFKLSIAKSPTSSSVAATSASNAANYVPPPASNQQRRTPQRKASVFSHDGFPALDKLDQKSLQQHSIRSQSVSNLAGSISSDKLANKSQQQHQQQAAEIQIVAQQHQQQVMIAGTSKTTELAAAQANSLTHSPQRSVRSDTLGSTGSSRASSCDEPTIISPLLETSPKKMLDEKSLKQSSPTVSSTSSLDSIKSDTPPASAIHSAYQRGEPKQSCDNNGRVLGDDTKNKDSLSDEPNVLSEASTLPMDMDGDSDLQKVRKISNDSSSTRSDDVFEYEAEAGTLRGANGALKVPPPFESIKNQIKRNSVPDAKTIRQHIDRLISQNEAIMENWNQVSIRSYNSQATSSTTDTVSTSTSSARTSPKPAAVADSNSSFTPSAKRPNKQRSSTTALYQGNVFSLKQEQLEQLRLQHSINQQANANFAAQNQESRRLTQDSLNELVGARLRRRSYNNQQSLKRLPVRETSDTGAINSMMPSPTIFEQPEVKNFSQTDQFRAAPYFSFGAATGPNISSRLDLAVPPANPVRQDGSNNTSIVSRESLGMCFNIDAKHLAERAAELARQTSFNLSIESAIENLSLKRQAGQIQQQQQQHQQNLLPRNTNSLQQPEDLILATLLAERQRHQQLLEDHNFQQQLLHAGKQEEAAIPVALLNYIQLQQQQQQTLDQQVSLNRLAALEQEYRQLNDRLLAPPMQQHQQQQQHQHLTNNQNSLIQSVNRLNERQRRESYLLNEFLAKMMLDRDDHNHHQQQQQHGLLVPHNHHSGPILKHSECNDQRPSEMFTQPLDSATPSHRCEACDISFWTRDLLNYHLMTSCSARAGRKSPTIRLQRLDELQRSKKETLTMPSVEVQESNLPIKKRKISEPNMR